MKSQKKQEWLDGILDVRKTHLNQTLNQLQNQNNITGCLDLIQQIKEEYKWGMHELFGLTLQECKMYRDEDIAKVNEVIKTLNK
jgi:hypothetical protein